VVVIDADIDRDVPLVTADQHAEMQMILDFVLVPRRLELGLGDELGFDIAVSKGH
jgi:hypothetical protein